MSQTRIRTDRFGDGWTVHVGKRANAIRQQIKAENLIACDLPTEEERRAAMIVDVEAEVGRRLGRVAADAEEWRPVVGFEGLYEVSSEGRVRSLSRRIRTHHGATKMHRGRVMTPVVDKYGYPRVILRVDGVHYTRKVHRLVCQAFHGDPPADCPHVDHIDMNKANARADNLRWISQIDNLRRRPRFQPVSDGAPLRGRRPAGFDPARGEAA